MVTANTSISGLVSGLDTASIIDQLMQLEAAPQNQLKTKQSAEQTVLGALQSVNSDFASLLTKATSLADPATWQTLKATSTSTDVSANLTPAATAGSFTVTVGQLATAAQTSYDGDHALTDTVVTGSPVTLTAADGTAHSVITGTGTLSDLAAGINAAKAGVTATTVRTGTNTYRLLLTADTTGAASAISLSNVALGNATASTGQDAQLTIGGIPASSASNTFTDLVPGVNVTLGATAKAGTTSTITAAQDSSSVKDAVKGLVDQVNSLLGSIDAKSANGAGTSGGPTGRRQHGPLCSRGARRDGLRHGQHVDGVVRHPARPLRQARLRRCGLRQGLRRRPHGRHEAVHVGEHRSDARPPRRLGSTSEAVAKAASDKYTGSITSAINGANATIDELTKSIADWDDRLELRRTTLQNQYTALETALSSMQSQGQWLSGQIAQLPTSSS